MVYWNYLITERKAFINVNQKKNESMNQKGYSSLNVNFNSSHRKNHPAGEE